jgi:hypothetical protein
MKNIDLPSKRFWLPVLKGMIDVMRKGLCPSGQTLNIWDVGSIIRRRSDYNSVEIFRPPFGAYATVGIPQLL